jgi:hypothetical protein
MNTSAPASTGVRRSFAGTAVALATHLFGALTCATCWAIFGPALALLLGSSINDFMAAMRPYAPFSAAIAATGLGYSIYQLLHSRERRKELPYRMAVAFTAFSVIGWSIGTAFIAVTMFKG